MNRTSSLITNLNLGTIRAPGIIHHRERTDWSAMTKEQQRKFYDDCLKRAAKVPTGNPTVKFITALFGMRLRGTFIPDFWRDWLKTRDGKRGRFDFVAADVLAELCYWHRAFKDEYGRYHVPKIVQPGGCKVTLTYFARALGHSVFQIRHALRRLGELGVITYEEDRLGQKCCYRININCQELCAISIGEPKLKRDGGLSPDQADEEEGE